MTTTPTMRRSIRQNPPGSTRIMRNRLHLFGLLSLLLAVWPCTAAIKPERLHCEYLDNPLGIDTPAPRLSWQLGSTERGQRQTAYRILVASTPERLKNDQGDLWDSGRVESDRGNHVPYAGRPLASRQAAYWKVRAWDKDGQAGRWSTMGSWEMGLLEPGDWAGARWIRLKQDNRNSPLTRRDFQTDNMPAPREAEAFPSPLMRREFEVKRGVRRARAYICGLGYHELYLNGQRCGDAVLEPAQTTYDVHAL